MELLLSSFAKISMPIFGYNFYKYQQLSNLDNLILTSPQINLDFMPINKDLEGKDCLFFGSLSSIKQEGKQLESLQLFSQFDVPNTKNHIKNVV